MILRILFSVITVTLAGYGLITRNFEFQAFMILFSGLTILVMGIQEFGLNKKPTILPNGKPIAFSCRSLKGWLFIVIFAFMLYVSIQSFVLYY